MTTETAVLTPRALNFSAGPAILPEEVILQAREDLWSIFDTGVGIMEHSHRGGAFKRVIEEAEADCRELGGIGEEYSVLFLQGGATTQFATIPMSFLGGGVADYADTGVWTTKAIKEAKRFGTVNVAFEGSAHGYDHVPSDEELSLSADAKYFHYCSNNTIYGTRYDHVPATGAPRIVDMSSEMFSRPFPIDQHAMVYAGAQKNLGPSGVTLVIIRRDFMERAATDVPTMFDYNKHAKAGSCLNTPPTFGIYVMGQVFKWLLGKGGLEAIERENDEKAAVVYDAIDKSGGFYRSVARDDCRSRMNVSFRTPSDELDQAFIAAAKAEGMDGLKGHRDAGGLRASIYNAFPKSGCATLASFMDAFAAENG